MRMGTRNPKPLKSLKPIFPKFFSSVALTSILASGVLVASGHPEGGDGRGLSVKVEVPWATFKIGETFVYRYTLRNASEKPVPIAIPIERLGLGNVTGGQAFLEPFQAGGRKVDDATFDVTKAEWPPKTEMDGEPEAWMWLQAGHQLTWNQNDLWPDYYGVGCYQSFEGFRAHWLTGPNQWISSDPVEVEIVSVPQSEWTEMFRVQWVSTGYRAGPRETIVYRIPIREHWYLFSNGWTRITEVEPDDQIEHSIDEDATNLEITIKSAASSRKVYFHLAQGYTRDTPWPIGPVSIFDPKPEPIPPAELDALRKQGGLGPADTVVKISKPSPNTSESSEASDKSRRDGAHVRWLWILAVVPALGILLVKLRRKS